MQGEVLKIHTGTEVTGELDLTAIFARVFIKPHVIKQVGGIIIPKAAKQMTVELAEGEIVSVGPDCRFAKAGMIVVYGRYAGADVKREMGTFKVMDEDDLIAEVKPKDILKGV